jgi:hypothetical protein
MAEDNVSLEFISRQLVQMREEQQAFRGEMLRRFNDIENRMVMNAGMWTRLDSTNTGIIAELRGMETMLTSLDDRVRRLEERA